MMVRYDLPPEVDNRNTLAGKAYPLFFRIDVNTLTPKWRGIQNALMHSANEEAKKFLQVFGLSMAIMIIYSLVYPAEYPMAINVGFLLWFIELVLYALHSKRRFNRFPIEIGQEGTETYYRVLMAQILGRKVLNVEGIMWDVT